MQGRVRDVAWKSRGEVRNAAGYPGGGGKKCCLEIQRRGKKCCLEIQRRGKKCCLENPRQGEILLCSNGISRKGVQF